MQAKVEREMALWMRGGSGKGVMVRNEYIYLSVTIELAYTAQLIPLACIVPKNRELRSPPLI